MKNYEYLEDWTNNELAEFSRYAKRYGRHFGYKKEENKFKKKSFFINQ